MKSLILILTLSLSGLVSAKTEELSARKAVFKLMNSLEGAIQYGYSDEGFCTLSGNYSLVTGTLKLALTAEYGEELISLNLSSSSSKNYQVTYESDGDYSVDTFITPGGNKIELVVMSDAGARLTFEKTINGKLVSVTCSEDF